MVGTAKNLMIKVEIDTSCVVVMTQEILNVVHLAGGFEKWSTSLLKSFPSLYMGKQMKQTSFASPNPQHPLKSQSGERYKMNV